MAEETAPQKPTPAEAELAVDKILHDPPTKLVKFMGIDITLRPLPVEYSQKWYMCIKPIRQKMGKMMAEFAKSLEQPDHKPPKKDKIAAKVLKTIPEKAEEYEEMDMMLANTLVDAVVILAGFYEITTTRELINKNATLQEVEALVNAQLEVNGKEDFLLKSFSAFMRTFLGTADDQTPYLDLLSTLASAKSGK